MSLLLLLYIYQLHLSQNHVLYHSAYSDVFVMALAGNPQFCMDTVECASSCPKTTRPKPPTQHRTLTLKTRSSHGFEPIRGYFELGKSRASSH